MGARQKLNGGYFLGSLLVAGVAAGLTGSWEVLVIGLIALVGVNINNGEIRFGRRRDR